MGGGGRGGGDGDGDSARELGKGGTEGVPREWEEPWLAGGRGVDRGL